MKLKLIATACLALGIPGAIALAPISPRVSPEAIQSAVTRSGPLLDRAWQLPVAASFRRDLVWQSNVSLCGPASVASAFRSLNERADTESAVLAGTGRCWTGFCVLGLTLDQLADVARTHTKRKVIVLRDLSADEFREHMRRANDSGRRYIINFSRASIFGGGAGHHSPVGGYMEAEDLVFVLDVNRNYQPWLIERPRLYSAMDTLDGDKKRGLLLIE
ncbi:phytochelatin synthase family protein [Methylobacterium nodulans]|uniref:glutathione gamma-glutamylcysteinyltransferase n=1 Tax=Methylobacterium nodulans (strain LMG 21967 / CNCM I-2342 / ORS 2060) TaxID=460265 RepID=B8IXD5_METNO|nr:phytochelatin synthase family protein [Methylobacterium nodulans]ACL63176.1 Phytochelatin synthase [Methylobacterium nodulans ORS 2060]